MENILLRSQAALTPPSVTNGAAPRKSCHVIVKRISIQRLRENVRVIVVRLDMLDYNLAISDQLTNLQITSLNVAGPLARLLVLRQLHSSLIVHVKNSGFEIVPKFAHGKLHLIRRDYGPFEPQVVVEVPLWLAVQLRRRQVCARGR